ncbi:uncharacterized protein PAC_08758 [Phialocephala subalpina]|uniref:Zn(2)-C6 fungal-type domain-containing protein n=1 Tax=Phialocephala subalpina TaxID=576137 RepID=A0A1L7X1G1_9HELO|nr:uncharacterized protein PAC_08758 [Phialocephala subalpina]
MTSSKAVAGLESTALPVDHPNERPETSTHTRKGERSRSGCITCRARKVKCDESPGACLNCGRLGVQCAGYSSGPLSKSIRSQLSAKRADPGLTEAGLERKRLRASCQPCRSSKTRCSGDHPACTRCQDKDFKCHYESRERRSDFPINHAIEDPRDCPENGPLQDEGYSSTAQNKPSSVQSANQSSQDHFESEPRRPRIEDRDSTVPADTRLPHWLFYTSLPNKERVYQLVDAYFTHMHPLRCFAFIHRPSFMEKLDQDLTNEGHGGALLHVICALGAKFYAIMPPSYDEQLVSKHILLAGNQWAKVAQREIFENINHISAENLMATILLYDHELRVGNHASAFMLSGTAARMSQALQINLEFSTDILCNENSSRLSCCARESRRRLMWSCYVLDSWVGSGVDQLTLIDDKDVKIQLPCTERNFLQQIPAITETMAEGQVLNFIPKTLKSTKASNMGIMAQFIRVAGVRKKVLRYLKTIDSSQAPNLPDTEFCQLEAAFGHWSSHLSSTDRLNSSSIYTRKDSGQLGALFLMHFTYHISLCDLYRLSMPLLLPGLLKNWSTVDLTPDQKSFRIEYQKKCFEHAKSAAQIFAKCIEHGPRTLTDTWLPTCAFESIRTMLFYSIEGYGHTTDFKRKLLSEVTPLCRGNMQSLKMMIPLFATAERCYIVATDLVRKAGLGPQVVEGACTTDDQLRSIQLEKPIDHNTPAAESPEHVLNPLSIYALTREDIGEKEHSRSGSHISSRSHTPITAVTSGDAAPHQTNLLPARQSTVAPSIMPVPPTHYPDRTDQNISRIPTAPYMPNVTPMWPQQNTQLPIDLFWMTFSSDFDGSWMPAETLQENVLTKGLPPWVPGFPDEQFMTGIP